MYIAKRIVGAAFTLLAVAILLVRFGSSGSEYASQSILDSPQASGPMLGTLIPVTLFGAVGAWLLFSRKPT
ncbi:MAG: hypothetical protein KY475_00920 [Planctomycetes bacterium]|nr:hypothetical protein [Planctomycetota bacterium]